MSKKRTIDYTTKHDTDKITVWRKKGIIPEDIKGMKNILKNLKKIEKNILKTYKNEGTIRNNYALLSKLARLYGDDRQHKYFKQQLSEYNSNIFKEKKNNKQDKLILKRSEIKEKLDELYDKRLDNLSKNYRYLLLSLYYYQPPLRNDFVDMEIIKNKLTNLDTKKINNKKDNFLVKKGDDMYFIINADKISSRVGGKHIKVNNTLKKIINESIEAFPRDYLLTNIRDVKKKMYTTAPLDIFKSIFKKPYSIKHFRQSYINDFYDGKKTMNQKEKLAENMRHSVNTAMIFYHKV
jgi:hypothetical protein